MTLQIRKAQDQIRSKNLCN